MSESNREDIRERLGNVDQIRDIIFGAQLRDYDNRLAKIEADVVMLQQDMRDRLDQMKAGITTELKVAVDALDKKLKSFSSNSQEECADLRQQVDRFNRKFTGSIQTLDEAVDSQTASIREELGQTKQQLQSDVSALRDLVLEELDRRFSHLGEVKVSRDDIAETFFELGMRLKGTDFVPKLKEKADGNLAYDLVPLLTTRKMPKELSITSEG